MKRLVLSSVASEFVVGVAIDQQSAPMPGMDTKSGMDMKMMAANPSDTASTKGYKAAMMKVMEGMPMDEIHLQRYRGQNTGAGHRHGGGKINCSDRRLAEGERNINRGRANSSTFV